MKEISNIHRYLSNVLGLGFVKADKEPVLPQPFSSFFNLCAINIDHIECCLLFPLGTSIKPSLLIKRINAVEQKIKKKCVVALNAMDKALRRELIKAGVSFIVPDRQLFMPFLGTYLSERRLNEIDKRKKLTPAAQLLILYHLQSESVENIPLSDVSNKLGYPLKTLSTIAKELKDARIGTIDILDSHSKSIKFYKKGRELWELVKPMLSSPISKTGYVSQEVVSKIPHAEKSGDDALSNYTDMGFTGRLSIALNRRSDLAKALIPDLEGTETSNCTEVEFWKYDPSLLAKNGYVDPLSMYLCFMDNPDERIKGQLERLLDKIL